MKKNIRNNKTDIREKSTGKQQHKIMYNGCRFHGIFLESGD
jgi:hypothetical protein